MAPRAQRRARGVNARAPPRRARAVRACWGDGPRPSGRRVHGAARARAAAVARDGPRVPGRSERSVRDRPRGAAGRRRPGGAARVAVARDPARRCAFDTRPAHCGRPGILRVGHRGGPGDARPEPPACRAQARPHASARGHRGRCARNARRTRRARGGGRPRSPARSRHARSALRLRDPRFGADRSGPR